MRTTTLAGILVASFAVACFIERPSETLTCSTNADCTGYPEFRACTGGYCVVPNCPPDCTSCDETARTCEVDCTSSDDCDGDIRCPDGWTCTISCVGFGACGNIICESGSRCQVTCSGNNACDDIRCSNACQCDVDCESGACDSMFCPSMGNLRCTVDGMPNTECDSTVDSRCTRC